MFFFIFFKKIHYCKYYCSYIFYWPTSTVLIKLFFKFINKCQTEILRCLTRKLCTHFMYKNYTRCMQLIYTKCIQNVYISTNFCIHFVNKIKRTMAANFLYKMSTKVSQNVGYILYTNIMYTFCIHQFWSTKCAHHKNYVFNLYTKFIQNVSTNNCMLNQPHISAYFDPFVVHFLVNHCTQLRLETCWLSMEVSIKSMD